MDWSRDLEYPELGPQCIICAEKVQQIECMLGYLPESRNEIIFVSSMRSSLIDFDRTLPSVVKSSFWINWRYNGQLFLLFLPSTSEHIGRKVKGVWGCLLNSNKASKVVFFIPSIFNLLSSYSPQSNFICADVSICRHSFSSVVFFIVVFFVCKSLYLY